MEKCCYFYALITVVTKKHLNWLISMIQNQQFCFLLSTVFRATEIVRFANCAKNFEKTRQFFDDCPMIHFGSFLITLLWESSCLPMSEVYDDLLQKLFALCIGRNLLCAGRTKKRSEKRGAISPLIYSRIITAWTLSPNSRLHWDYSRRRGSGA